MIKFSIIIPLYNKANFVCTTIESILAQTFNDYEIIVVNDGSTDNSLTVVNELNDARIHIFSKENGGVSAARNFGIDKAQNEYITFLDADDLWLPDYLETIKGMIEQYPQAGVFATTYTYINHLNEKYDRLNYNLQRGEIVVVDNYCKSIINGEIKQLCTDTICVKKVLFEQTGGFREGIKRGEDIDMWLRLSLVSTIIWKNDTKAIYNGVTENNAAFCKDSYKYDFPYWEWYGYNSSIYTKMYANYNIKRLLLSHNFSSKLCIFFKINWYYVLLHLLYICCKPFRKKFYYTSKK